MFFSELRGHFQRQKETERRREACRNIATGVAIGTIIGFTAGILFAPKSGKETRQAIADKTVEISGQGKQLVSEAIEKIKSKVSSIERSAYGVAEQLQEGIHEEAGH